ncbi:hypothetical protein LTS14_008128 [Recurvomyces mirabilis]|uniref:uncharacterized protein n=1 Tax=Recurvomyces mirabilis TaxID=574656 RepID=UPI002DDF2FF5|nr:hypothetical protein LTS14_008128 [Recurvomyces mirabilis]
MQAHLMPPVERLRIFCTISSAYTARPRTSFVLQRNGFKPERTRAVVQRAQLSGHSVLRYDPHRQIDYRGTDPLSLKDATEASQSSVETATLTGPRLDQTSHTQDDKLKVDSEVNGREGEGEKADEDAKDHKSLAAAAAKLIEVLHMHLVLTTVLGVIVLAFTIHATYQWAEAASRVKSMHLLVEGLQDKEFEAEKRKLLRTREAKLIEREIEQIKWETTCSAADLRSPPEIAAIR